MNAAPAGPRQRGDRGGRPASDECGTRVERGEQELQAGLLRERLERAEREGRVARRWACIMAGLAVSAGLTASLLFVHLNERRLDERSLQRLAMALETQNQREARAAVAQASVVPARSGTQVTITPAAGSPGRGAKERQAEPAVAARPDGSADRRLAARAIPPLVSAASSFSSFRVEKPDAPKGAVGEEPAGEPTPVDWDGGRNDRVTQVGRRRRRTRSSRFAGDCRSAEGSLHTSGQQHSRHADCRLHSGKSARTDASPNSPVVSASPSSQGRQRAGTAGRSRRRGGYHALGRPCPWCRAGWRYDTAAGHHRRIGARAARSARKHAAGLRMALVSGRKLPQHAEQLAGLSGRQSRVDQGEF